MTNEIATYLKYANLQMAAEALYGLKASSPGSTFSGEIGSANVNVLTTGNERSSKFTPVQADEFAKDWTVVEHISNTTTGFSGTLFRALRTDESRGITTGELVLSFRSTEFADDATRDNQATNVMEIKAEGWALGQIADMEKWFSELKASGKLSATDRLSVTGYSLGGHLATAFNLLHKNDRTAVGEPLIAATYTFNGAGVGEVVNGKSLAQVISDFNAHRQLGSNADLFSDVGVRARYDRLKDLFKEGATFSLAQVDAEMQSLAQQGLVRTEELTLYKALERIRSIVYEAERIDVGVPSGTSGASALPISVSNIAAVGLDYQLSVLRVGQNTQGYRTDPLSGGIDAYAGRNPAPGGTLDNFYDLYGAVPPSAVANSQLHYGSPVPIFVEDQPLYRGSIFADVGTTTLKAGEVKLLVDNFGLNDFGDTHSLVLIVDSLNVQNTLARLDPTLTTERMSALLKAASNLKAEAQRLTQGKADGDTLESLVNALADTLGLGWTGEARLEGDPSGNTWARVEDQNGYSGRDTFYQQLKQLTGSGIYQSLQGKVTLQSVPSSGSAFATQAKARASFADIAALQTLSPFVLKSVGAAGEAALDSLWQSGAWGEKYNAWLQDKALISLGKPATSYTDEWIADRADMLRWYITRNTTDVDRVRMPGVSESVLYRDLATATSFYLTNTNGGEPAPMSTRQVTFGGNAGDELGGGDRDDRLYGGAGADVLNGGRGYDYLQGDAGADTLDGGTGDDTLVGGTGADTYVIAPDSGRDTILDADDRGTIQLAGRSLTGAGELVSTATLTQPYTVWLDDSNAAQPIRYSLNTLTAELAITGAGSTVIVKSFTNGDLGIAVPAATSPVAVVPPRTFDLATSAGRSALAALTPEQGNAGLRLDNAVFADARYLSVSGAAGNDTLTGGSAISPSGTILNGGGGDDRIWAGVETTLAAAIATGDTATPNDSPTLLLAGNEGNDQLIGAAGDDILFGGTGDDTLVGGAGSDIILADGDNTGYQSADGVTSWSSGSNTANGPGRSLRMRVLSARVGETASNGTGLRVATEHTIDQSIDPLANTDLSGLLAMRAQDIVPDAGDTRSYVPGTQRTFTQVNGGKAMGTNVGSGADVIYAGAGDDIVNAGAGDDIVFAGSGMDAVAGYEGDDFIEGGDGADTLWGDYTAYNAAGAVETHTEFGATWTVQRQLDPARHGRDFIDGGEGNDTIYGGGQADALYGGAGDDVILGDDRNIGASYAGDDYLDGGSGNDRLDGGAGSDTLFGVTGDDVLRGDSQNAAPADQGNDSLDGGAGDDLLIGGGGNDILLGGAGDDDLFGDDDPASLAGENHGDDTLDGGDGNDTLLGHGGNDVLIGGKGNDDLDGGAGDDRYVIGAEDVDANTGIAEVLTDAAGDDTVEFQGPVSAVGASTDGDLVLALGQVSEQRQLTLKGGYLGAFERIVVGGQEFDLRDWLQANTTQAVNLTVQSGQSAWGAGGADRLSAAYGAANVTLDGGKGNDYYDLSTNWRGGATVKLQMGDGIDTVWSGNDTRQSGWTKSRFLFGPGITGESLQLGQTFNASSRSLEMSLSYGTQGDRIFLRGNNFDSFEFADGSAITWQQLADKGVRMDMADNPGSSGYYGEGTRYRDIITGRADNNTIHGFQGDDLIDGGAGADTIYGDGGSDVFLFGRGDGQDQILGYSDAGDQDVLRFKAGLSLADVMFIRSGDDLIARLSGSTDKVTVVGAYGSNALHRVEFSDGLSIRLADLSLASAQQQATAGADVINLSPLGETVDALAGDDTVRGGIGNDTIDGNAGTDRLYGGAGNDTIRGGDGYDALYGEAGDDRLEDVDAQYLNGGDGNDTIIGRAYLVSPGGGDDWVDATGSTIDLWGGGGNDTVVIRPSVVDTAHTVIKGFGTVAGQTMTIRFASGIDPASLRISSQEEQISGSSYASTSYLRVEIPGSKGDLRIEKFMELSAEQQGIRFVFDDAPKVVLSYADVRALANTATALDNSLWGTRGADTLDGLAGNDILHGREGNDTLIGGAGNDTLYGDAGDDVLVASGQDTLDGGEGNDIYRILDGRHVIRAGASPDRDSVEFGAGIRPEDIEVSHDGNDALLSGKDGLSVRLKSFFASTTASTGIQEIRFASFPQTVWAADTLRQRAITGNDGNNSLYGFDGLDDVMAGGAGNDRLEGGSGNDTLDGGAGDDDLIGGAGNDTYRFQRGGGQDILTDSAGVDTVQLGAGILPSDVTLIRTSSAPSHRVPGSVVSNTGADSLVIALAGGEQLWIPGHFTSAGAIESIRFADGTTWAASDINTRLLNSAGTANTQTGTPGNDTYTVDHGSDQIIERANGGTDLVNSTVSYRLPDNVENLTLTGVLNIDATGNDGANVITGNAGDNVLDGGAGGDRLVGGPGNDTYIVESDLPTTVPDYAMRPLDVIVETAGGGIDTLVTKLYRVRLPDEVENLSISGNTVTAISGAPKGLYGNGIVTYGDAYKAYADDKNDTRPWYQGNALDNVIDLTYGGTISSPLAFGYAFGGALVDGGAGADRMIGGSEDTYFMIDNAGDVVVEAPGGGQDVMGSSSLSLTVAPNVEGIELLGSLALSATGDAGSNDLRASKNTARNVLTGLGGDDTYFVDAGDVVIEAPGGGNDRVVIDVVQGASSVLRSSGKTFYLDDYPNVENIAANGAVPWTNDAQGREGVRLVGNARDNGISGSLGNDTLEGGAGNDVIEDQYRELVPGGAGRTFDRDELYGGDGNDRLVSYFGSDLLDGGAGDDTLVRVFSDPGTRVVLRGGTGNDRYEIVEAASVVSEDAGGGIDTVQFAGSGGYTLGDNVENLTLAGTDAINGTGNALANVLTGNAASNTLNGGAGNDNLDGGAGIDTLIGGTGNDLYVVDSPQDSAIENADEGIDTVKASVSWTLGPTFEHLWLTGSGNINGTGTDGPNLLVSNAGDNILDGLGGIDTVSYQDATAAVNVSLAISGPQATGGSGTDTLRNVERLFGSRFDDRLTGNADANLFDGGAGDDVMMGGAGNDVYRYRSGSGNDRVLDDGGDDLVDLPDLQPGDVRIVQGLHGDDDRIVDRLTGQGITLDLNLGPAGSAASQVERLRFADGTVWNAEQMRASAELDRQVQLLVQAMASFSPPPMGQSTLSPGYQDSLAPMLAVNPSF